MLLAIRLKEIDIVIVRVSDFAFLFVWILRFSEKIEVHNAIRISNLLYWNNSSDVFQSIFLQKRQDKKIYI